MIELSVFMLIPLALAVGGLAWLLARKRPHWSKLRICLLAPLPLPALIAAASIAAMSYGWNLPGETCGLDECGGYMIMGVLGLALAFGALLLGIPAAIVGAVIARRGMEAYEPLPGETFQ